ncbi:hypothetical protein [Pelomonas sp. SE-A7]|uniref:hypothetical protein n=1 Tax=Pelomonas sp. SE-A7 TaxID=3054953 RepID=UPI00259CD590|nr:hypothetical protein [Pelomonas sp. SE-A7]MDM4768277.1 hypothetical protein [Pelomonas sp. SE-A7]
MEHQAGLSFSHSADYTYIDYALRARWEPFVALEQEVTNFVPRTTGDFADHRVAELARLKRLNPDSPDEPLLEIIDGQIRANADPALQTYFRFNDRVMSEYVTVAFLAHALAEASINTILAIGLATSDAVDLFALIERADIKEKWVAGPKAFHPPYSLAKGATLYQTLQHLTRQRNSFVHYKIELEMNGKKTLEGSRLDRVPLQTQLQWIRRFFSLPYDLVSHVRSQIPGYPGLMLYDPTPVERFAAHSAT